MDIYFTDDFGEKLNLLENSFASLTALMTDNDKDVLFATGNTTSLQNSAAFGEFFGIETVKQFLNHQEATFRGTHFYHVTQNNFRDRFARLIYAPHVSINFLEQLIALPPLTEAVVYVPWTGAELVEMKKKYPNAKAVSNR